MPRLTLNILLFIASWSGSGFAQNATFKKTYYTAPTMKTEAAVDLTIGNTQLEIVGKKPKDFGNLAIPLASIDTMTYESDTRHRVAEGGAQMAISPTIGALIMATKTTSYWLAIHYHDEAGAHTVVLQLDKTEYQQVLDTLKARTGKEISEVTGQSTDLNPTAGSKDMDEIAPYPTAALIAAIKPAMAEVGCSVTVDKPNRIECKRPRGGSEINGVGGEKIVATFEPMGEKTQVHIETDKGFNGHMMKKNWSTPIFREMMKRLEKPEGSGL